MIPPAVEAPPERQSADVVVVGAGVAGLSAALALAGTHRVVLLAKARLGTGAASVWAQGGVAAAVGPDDSPERHARDTLAAGAGLGQADAVAVLTTEGPRRLRELIAQGAHFDRDAHGELALGREAAHSRRRILHAQGDATGAEMVRALAAAVRREAAIQVLEQVFAVDLVVDQGHVAGLRLRDAAGRPGLIQAPAVVLATGGIGRVYARTTNPAAATGDGLAMAARAGARLADLEMVQFHPTALDVDTDPLPLISEALRGDGAVLVDDRGTRFMPAVHPAAELAPRDIVARAIWQRQAEGRRVLLDARHAIGAAFPERFPTIFALCRRYGLDPRVEPIPVTPAAHYHMGGIAVDLGGRSSLPGLWACGEVAASGVHGANRLASNSLLEALVFGARVADDIGVRPPAAHGDGTFPATADLLAAPAGRAAAGAALIATLRQLMWQHVGVIRSEPGLRTALTAMATLAAELPPGAGEARNLVEVGRLIATAALARRESRGGHYRADFPSPDPRWQHRLFLIDPPRPSQPLPAPGPNPKIQHPKSKIQHRPPHPHPIAPTP
jgi:L-aspartate oxidase